MSHPTKRFPKPLNDDEIVLIADSMLHMNDYMNSKLSQFIKYRNYTAWLLMNYAGLRPGECLKLRWQDINFEKRRIQLSPYWNKVRIDIPAILTKPAERIIISYRKELQKIGIFSIYMFPSVSSWEPLSTDRFGDIVRKAALSCGVAHIDWFTEAGQPKYNVKPYSGRHNFCTKIWKKTHSELAVMNLARHTNQESAQFYVHLDSDDKTKIADSVFE